MGALRREPSPPPACSLVPREAVDPSPNFGGGVQGRPSCASYGRIAGAVLPLSARNERGGGRGEGPTGADDRALRREPSPPTACSLVPREAVDPSPNFGGGVQGRARLAPDVACPAQFSPPRGKSGERAGEWAGGGGPR